MKFILHWLGGEREDVEGDTLARAFSNAGYGNGALSALDWVETVKENAFVRMANLTRPVCAMECRSPQSCCTPDACENTRTYAASQGVTLQNTGHPRLPFMGETGCSVSPELRPICTVHVCCINDLGFRPGKEEWTEEYFELREEINQILMEQQEVGK